LPVRLARTRCRAWAATARWKTGDDVLYGGPGRDDVGGDDHQVHGWYGDDTLYGGDGDEGIFVGYGEDTLHRGEGYDQLLASKDGQSDVLHCGPGRDTYIAEKLGFVAYDCKVKANAQKHTPIVG
jgi:Ca2+-binding RTX toxin-like protein